MQSTSKTSKGRNQVILAVLLLLLPAILGVAYFVWPVCFNLRCIESYRIGEHHYRFTGAFCFQSLPNDFFTPKKFEDADVRPLFEKIAMHQLMIEYLLSGGPGLVISDFDRGQVNVIRWRDYAGNNDLHEIETCGRDVELQLLPFK